MKRMQWALTHCDKAESDLKKLYRELKFEIFSSRKIYVQCSTKQKIIQCVVPTITHNSDVRYGVWGCFSGHGTRDLVQIKGFMKSGQYKLILKQILILPALKLVGNGFLFQQDSDPKHSSKLLKGFLEHKESQNRLKQVVPLSILLNFYGKT